MNERIMEFAEQAGFTEWHRMDNPNGDAVIQTFAELIVRECADLFDKDEIELSYTMRTIHNTIKEHFGVEE